MTKPDSLLFAPKSEARQRIYAYEIHDQQHHGLLKVGQTNRDVKKRVGEQLKTAGIHNFRIVLDVSAERPDGSIFRDHDVRARLKQKGFENPFGEWMRCSLRDVETAITELRTNTAHTGTHHDTFPMRDEQRAAVDKAEAYIRSAWSEDVVPEFLWNAKMRFGKTFTAYQLAKRLEAKRVLVMTFKPAVEDAWKSDLENHVDFEGWQYFSRTTPGKPEDADPDRPLVFFGSFQDLMGKDAAGNFKAKHKWLSDLTWDLVIFDEYHFGAWRDAAKELFEGEDAEAAELKEEFNPALETFAEQLEVLENDEDGFIPLQVKAYLYLSGTPFKALATGRFIEDQIFNWTYTDEQRAKARFAAEHPGEWNPYGALPDLSDAR